MPFGADNASTSEDTKMRRHCVLRHIELAGDFAGRHALRFLPDQETEDIKARPLRERTERSDS